MSDSVRKAGRLIDTHDVLTGPGRVTFRVDRFGPILPGFGAGRIAYDEGGNVRAVYDGETYTVRPR